MANGNVLLRAALSYAGRGWAVFPVKPNGKSPITPNGFKDATTDPKKIRSWWAVNPKANIGVATGLSGLVVIDGDVKNGDDPDVSLRNLLDGQSIPDTLRADTPSGGWHLFFEAIPGTDVRTTAGKLGAGLDVRAAGGYVVVAPSVGLV